MSRIFEALQRSSSDGIDFDPSLITSLVAEVPASDEKPTSGKINLDTSGANRVGPFPSVQIVTSPDSRLIGLADQSALASEKFRFLSVRLRQLRRTTSLKKILITSAMPEEGKSMIAANLAITLAQRKQETVLLVEGDLRRPSLCARFGLPKLRGLSEWLQSDLRSIRDICHLDGAGLWLLPAGHPPETNLELMQSERLSILSDQLTGCFDWIVIDSPPVVPLADTSVWMRFADGILLVARQGTIQKEPLKRGLQELDRSKLLGVVLNSSTSPVDNYYQTLGLYGNAER